MDNVTKQSIFQKYEKCFEQCDFKESIEVYEKGIEIYGKSNFDENLSSPDFFTLINKTRDKLLGLKTSRTFRDYLSSKNQSLIMPLKKLQLKNDFLTESEREQGYTSVSYTSDGIVGIYFDNPLQSDLEIEFHVRNTIYGSSFVIPKGTIHYKIPQIIFTFQFTLLDQMLVKGMIPGSTLFGTIVSQDDRNFLFAS